MRLGRWVTGGLYTIAGSASSSGYSGDDGPAAAALLDLPVAVAVDNSGDLYISDLLNNRVQEIAADNGIQRGQAMTGGDIYTVAGSATGIFGSGGMGGPGTAAQFYYVYGIAVDPDGDLFIADRFNNDVDEAISNSDTPFGTSPTGDGVTVSQADGSQVTFYPQSGGNCTAPYVQAGSGGYCTLPENVAATLSYSSGGGGTYTYSPEPGESYTYSSGGALRSESDAAGDTLLVSYGSPSPGSGNCPSSANWCQTVTSASGRALTIGYNSADLVTSVTDPMARSWTYGYTSSDLTSATDSMSNKTSYTYGAGSTGNPQLANDLLTITKPNAQPGGPDVGDDTVTVYDAYGRVTSQTDPKGWFTAFNYCVNVGDGSCLNTATDTGSTTVTDPDGDTTVDTYSLGSLTGEADLTGGTTLTSAEAFAPDQSVTGSGSGSQLDTATIDGNGNITTVSYDNHGNRTSVSAPDGVGTQSAAATQQFTGLDRANCSSAQIASSNCSASEGPPPVAPGGVITPPSSAPPQGITWTLYDTGGNELYSTTGVYEPGSSTAAYSQTTYQLFNGNSVTLSGNNITCTASAPSPSVPCATISADKVVTQLAYNAEGDLTSTSTPDGNPGSETAKTTYGYDADGEQTSETSPDGNLAGASTGNYTTISTYNNDGQQTSVSDGDGSGHTVTPRTTSYGFDADGNPTTVDDARGYTTTTAYNADDEATLVTDPDDNATLTCYDGGGNTVQTIPPAGVAANSLTAASCPASYPGGYSTRLASDATVDTFDSDGNLTQETTPAPAGQSGYETTTYAYDGDGNVLTTTAPPTANGGPSQVTTDTYNSADELIAETTGYGTDAASTVSYCYNPSGDQTSMIYPDGNTSGVAPCETSSPWDVSAASYPAQAAYQTTYSYDSADELVSTTAPATSAAPDGATTSETYDAAGNTLTSTDPNDVTTTWTYTPLGQAATIAYSGSSAHAVSYGYDADGNLIAMNDATGTSGYLYDSFDELISATDGAGQTSGYGYDADGLVSSVTYPLPAAATWATTSAATDTYDPADVLTKITDFNGNAITVGHTADGLPSSVGLGSTGDTITTTYDSTGSPSKISLQNASSTLQTFSYTEAPSSSILSECDVATGCSGPSAAYTYDAANRVTSMSPHGGTTQDYGFDASGNLTTLPGGADASNGYDHAGELTSSALAGVTTTYSYNADGERLQGAQGGSTIASATWNGAGLLTSYDDSAANMSAATYDGNGLLATATSGAGTQNLTWTAAGDLPTLLMDSDNAYIYATGSAPAEQVNLTTGAITYLVADSLGSVRGTVNSSGSLTATTSYDAWGNPASSGGLTSATPFGYAGAYTEPTGLIYLINRYYDPETGQFISVDPDVSQTLQPYAYVDDNPVSTIDPQGLAAIDWKERGRSCDGDTRWCALYVSVSVYSNFLNTIVDSLEVGFRGTAPL